MKVCLVVIGMLLVPGVAVANTATGNWQFDVFLDEKKIGYHNFQVRQEGNGIKMQTTAAFDVNVLFVNLYRYRHENTELWQDGCLQEIRASTDANGDDFMVSGTSKPSGFVVENTSTSNNLPGCIKTFAYWDPAFLEADRLLNPQTGEYEKVEINEIGEESLEVQGKTVAAVRYELLADAAPISLWYSIDDKRWLALETVASGGRVLRYAPR
ncbi:MAG: DUF6134 family protein [Pseudomonadales bacterium]